MPEEYMNYINPYCCWEEKLPSGTEPQNAGKAFLDHQHPNDSLSADRPFRTNNTLKMLLETVKPIKLTP